MSEDVHGRLNPAGEATGTSPAGRLPSVTLAVLTYRRPADLAAILPLLLDQAASVPNHCDVLVVDNDAAGAGAAQALAFGNRLVTAVVEPRPGIAAARNRALEEAASAELLVFIDDDERPCDDWLSRLLATFDRTKPTGVVGPVISEYEHLPDEWITAGRFFDRRRLPTGTAVDVAATNNLLLDLAAIRGMDLRFDERFGISGGSDTLFTRQITHRGGTLIWCDEAVVVDVVPSSRLTRDWVLRRAFRSGNGWSRTSMVLAASGRDRFVTRIRLTGVGAVRVLGGAGRAVVGFVTRSIGQRARGTRTIARGLGMVSGAYGVVYSEYARTADPDSPNSVITSSTTGRR